MTHYHADHIGNFDDTASGTENGYKLQGITHLAKLIDIDKIIDRNWPDYDNLGTDNAINIADYKAFMDCRNSNSKTNEKFVVGSNSQFPLKNNPSAFSTFSVRNVAGNCNYWSGWGNISLSAGFNNTSDENKHSCGIRISYGSFDWYSSGDIYDKAETQTASVCGVTDAVVCNHHASSSMSEEAVKDLQATAWIIPAWGESHASTTAVGNMLNTSLYTGDRHIFAAGLTDASRTNLGADADKIKVGHIVIRVYEGGSQWQVFVLDQTSTDYHILSLTEVLDSK